VQENVEIRFFNDHELQTPIDGKSDLRLIDNDIEVQRRKLSNNS